LAVPVSKANEPEEITNIPSQVEVLQELQPAAKMQGHELCADIHSALAVARAVLTSRDERVAPVAETESSAALIRELRAFGVQEVAPQLISMVALVDIAVGEIAELGGMNGDEAWEHFNRSVLRKHCQAPDRA
jgi:hypothetical protein